MKKYIVFILILLGVSHVFGQGKSLIDTGMLGLWPRISPSEDHVILSENGHYVAYIINNQPIGKRTLVLQDLRTKWNISSVNNKSRLLFFSKDSQRLCWVSGDSVWLHETGRDKILCLGSASSISYPIDAKGEWIILKDEEKDSLVRIINIITRRERMVSSVTSHKWFKLGKKLLLSRSDGTLDILDLVFGRDKSFANVKDYSLSPDEKSLFLLTGNNSLDDEQVLRWVNLENGKSIVVWKGANTDEVRDFVYTKESDQVAFTSHSVDGTISIWHYELGKSFSNKVLDSKSTNISSKFILSNLRAFSTNGRWLFFNLRRQLSLARANEVITPVNIWSYRDENLNPVQYEDLGTSRDYAAVIELGSKKYRVLEETKDETIWPLSSDFLVLSKGGTLATNIGTWWPHGEPVSIWRVSLETGKRYLIKQNCSKNFNWGSSPDGKWIYYWDGDMGRYFSVNPTTGKTFNLTDNLSIDLIDENVQLTSTIPVGIAGWYSNGSAVLVYDNYDVWKLDLSAKLAPVNITGGYGRAHGIKLRLLNGNGGFYQGSEELLLAGFDVKTKYNGFFRISLGKKVEPEVLTLGPYTYFQTIIDYQSFGVGMQPILGGSGRNKRYIVKRESATEYPNFYVSKDLKTFRPLTNLAPQKVYNWLTTEVVSWKMYNGQVNYGVLYKPEDFDPRKKYPIIFNYYEKYSHRCYQFPTPKLTTDNINIPWFVSRGYLVFTPDIQYTIASKPGGMTISEAAYNAVASAAEYLSQRSYVNKSRMGLQGHSFGGHETNAIITQTGLFAAAAEVAGYSDHLSAYLTLVGFPVEKEHKIDHYNQRMGATPWERPDLFHKNSPVLNADKVTTPLFIVHNEKDVAVNFRQGLEMYMALRRLGKPCWMLQYDNGGHVLSDRKDALDYTLRLTQYFDHYLKGEPAPQWMTMNTLAPYKGKNNLYELDPKGNCGKDCKVCKEWNAKEIFREAGDGKNKNEMTLK